MANIKSAIKRVKTAEKANARNTSQKSALRTTVKKAEVAVSTSDENAKVLTTVAARQLDKAASKGLIHKNAAARKKSRMAKKVNSLQA